MEPTARNTRTISATVAGFSAVCAKADSMRGRLIRALFIAICVGLAWCAWSSWSEAPPQYKNETLIKATIMLYALTLPSSCLLGLIHAGLILMIPMDRLDAGSAFLNWMFQTWAPLTVAGYLQWFVLVPRLVGRWRDRNTGSV